MATCRLCSKKAPLPEGLCAVCVSTYGPKAALFLARAQVDPDFANAALSRLEPPARQRLLAAVSQRYLASGLRPGLRKTTAYRPEVSHRRQSA